MRAEVIDAHARVLSAVPFFDIPTAADIVSTFAGDVSPGADKVASSLSDLRLSGLLEKQGTSWRIAEPARQDYLEDLKKDYAETYRGAVGLFLTHATNGFGPSLSATVGERGADLIIRVMRLAVADSPDAAFAEVIDHVQAAGRSGRESDARVAQLVISDLPPYGERDRHLALLVGLELWRTGRHAEARQHFERVLKGQSADVSSAIAGHLLAVSWREVGEEEKASTYVTQAIADLRSLGDRRGLRMALTTCGGVEREIFSRLLAQADDVSLGGPERKRLLEQAQTHYDAAQDALDEAIGIADELADRSGGGVAKLELASCFQRWGEAWIALEVAEDARDSLEPEDPDYLRALTLLASLYRDVADISSAGEALQEAATVAESIGASTASMARTLNVLASVERRQGRFENAVRDARRSVELGRNLSNDRHLGQALNTLASALIDLAATRADLEAAEDALSESRRILARRRDMRGLDMVSRTQRRLDQKLVSLGEHSSEEASGIDT